MATNALSEAATGALAVTRLGLRVFPVWGVRGVECLCGQTACSNAGKHPIEKGWQGIASGQARRVEHWDRMYRGCNFGILGDDLVTVDVDPKNGGSLGTLPEWLPPTNYVVSTGGGGWHLGYSPGGQKVANAKLAPGLDLKATGGYVVAPGSLHVSGRRYRAVALPGDRSSFVPWPSEDAAAARAVPGTADGGARSRLTALLVAPAAPGGRNDWLAQVAGHYAKAFPGYRDAFDFHVRQAVALLTEPLPESEIAKLIESIWAKERSKPTPDQWSPIDLGQVLRDPPAVPERFGPGGMLYRGEVHWLAGEPESGKSIVVYAAGVDEMKQDHTVLLLDEDAGIRDAATKLAALGATDAMLSDRLVYLPPAGRDLFKDWARLASIVIDVTPTLCIVDAAADHLAAADKDEDRARDVTAFMNRVLKPLAQQFGICVVVVDHKTKGDPEGRYARASGSKLAKTEVGYNISAPEPFSRERSGRLHIVCTKDKPGYIGRDTSWMVYVDVADHGARITLHVNEPMAPEETRQAVAASRPQKKPGSARVPDQVLEIVVGSVVPLLVSEIAAAMKNPPSRTRLSRILNDLKRDGLIVDEASGTGSEKRWREQA